MPWHEGLRARRFWEKVEKTDGCWLWRGFVGLNGYGQVCVHYRKLSAHRYVFTLLGKSIPPGMFVCHRCDNPRCVRPDHLFLGTHADNMRDMVSKGRQAQPRRVTDRFRCGHAATAPNVAYYTSHRGVRSPRCRTCHQEGVRRSRAAKRLFAELPGAEG